MDAARSASLTAPERSFKRAQKKIKAGDYNFAADLKTGKYSTLLVLPNLPPTAPPRTIASRESTEFVADLRADAPRGSSIPFTESFASLFDHGPLHTPA